MSQETTHIPKLRFPEFEGEWVIGKIADQFLQSKIKGRKGINTYSITIDKGWIMRNELERETATNLSDEEHLLAEKGDIAYNMMRMWQGAFGRANEDGLISPAYVILKPQEHSDSKFATYSFKRLRAISVSYTHLRAHETREDLPSPRDQRGSRMPSSA